MDKKEKSKNKILIIICILLLIAMIGVTYAWYTQILVGKQVNTIVAGTLSVNLHEKEYIDISGADAIPLSKQTALTKEDNIYNFDLENNGNIDSKYTIYLDIQNKEGEEVIPNDCIRFILTKNQVSRTDQLLSEATTDNDISSTDKGKIILDSSEYDETSKVLKPGEKNTYSLRIWIDEEATTAIANHVFRAKIKISASQTEMD